MIDLKTKKILITGGHGFLGKHLVCNLVEKRKVPHKNLYLPTQQDLDLRVWGNCQKAVKDVDVVFHLAANVGGLGYNQANPGAMLYDNLVMGVQLMEVARQAGVEKMVVVGTTCCYPNRVKVPTQEQYLWQGYPEPITAPYGLAKLILLEQGQAYEKQYGFKSIFLIPTNLYGPEDHFEPERSHVVAALVKRFVDATSNNAPFVEVWGTGRASREFIYIEDAAEALALAAERYEKTDPINIGSGVETPIKELAQLMKKLTGYKGKIRFDRSKPDGRLRRALDVNKAKQEFGFQARTSLQEGLRRTIKWYQNHLAARP